MALGQTMKRVFQLRTGMMTTMDDRRKIGERRESEGGETTETPPFDEKTFPNEIWCEMIFAPPGSGKSVLFPTVCGIERKPPN